MAGTESFFDFHSRVNRPPPRAPAPAAGVAGAPKADGANEPITVSALTALIDGALKRGLPANVLVKGEVSNLNARSASGHLYFTMKDGGSCLDCVMFKDAASRLRFDPEDGMELIAGGQVKVYAQRGRYQLYVRSLEPVGQGALELAFRQLHDKLAREGLFAAERKKAIPLYPRRIALVTSGAGAALQDMLKVLRRLPFLRLMLYSVAVQGEQAAPQIADALKLISRDARRVGGVDVILLGRGGGSLEDLWAFNEEIVARAVAASAIPVVTGIGHEVDVSISDLVADHHAHTPTEAATFVTRNWLTADDALDAAALGLRRELRRTLTEARQRLTAAERHEFFRRPGERIARQQQVLDDLGRQLGQKLERKVAAARQRLDRARANLADHHPRHRLRLATQHVDQAGKRLDVAWGASVRRQHDRLNLLSARLEALSPLAVLRRGYSLTTRKDTGEVIRRPADVSAGDALVTRLAEGEVESVVAEGPGFAADAPAKARETPSAPAGPVAAPSPASPSKPRKSPRKASPPPAGDGPSLF